MQNKVIVFDVGGTLMEFVGMPMSWADHYECGLDNVNKKFQCQCSSDDIKLASAVIKSYNPRINYREKEISPLTIFEEAVGQWKNIHDIRSAVDTFWKGIGLKADIYNDTVSALKYLKSRGYILCTLTDIPNAMPDEIMREHISELLPYFDLYVSSQSCGYRKPDTHGIDEISAYFSVLPDEMIFIGDEDKDAKTAANAGCRFVKIDRSKTEKNAVNDLNEFINFIS